MPQYGEQTENSINTGKKLTKMKTMAGENGVKEQAKYSKRQNVSGSARLPTGWMANRRRLATMLGLLHAAFARGARATCLHRTKSSVRHSDRKQRGPWEELNHQKLKSSRVGGGGGSSHNPEASLAICFEFNFA